jgi:DNA-binding NarL/FixJ family response regulator
MAAWHDLARIGFAGRAVEALARLTPAVTGSLSAARSGHARALVEADVDGLAEAADGFEACGAILLAAEAAADASATAQRRQRGRMAEHLGRRAWALASRCQGADTPSLRSMGPARTLTRREREVAQMAADGMASKMIAARLGLAVRTVENHLQRSYEKLGVSDRTGLREVLDVTAE